MDVAERLTDGAERLINRRLRPDEARTKLANARAQLVRAGRHARAWGRCLNNTVASIAAVHQEAATEPLMAEALADGVSVSKRVAEIAGRLGAVITQYRDITIEVPCGGVIALLQQFLPKHGPPPPDLRFDHKQHTSSPSSPLREGFRRVTRGRAPPGYRTALLHAVPAAAERPVGPRSLS
jgi:hypothetical protein